MNTKALQEKKKGLYMQDVAILLLFSSCAIKKNSKAIGSECSFCHPGRLRRTTSQDAPWRMESHVSCSLVCQIGSARVSDCLVPYPAGGRIFWGLGSRAHPPWVVTADSGLETRSMIPRRANLGSSSDGDEQIAHWLTGPQASLECLLGVNWLWFLLSGVHGNVLFLYKQPGTPAGWGGRDSVCSEHKWNPQMPPRAKGSSAVAAVPSSASQTHITWSSVLLSIATKSSTSDRFWRPSSIINKLCNHSELQSYQHLGLLVRKQD